MQPIGPLCNFLQGQCERTIAFGAVPEAAASGIETAASCLAGCNVAASRQPLSNVAAAAAAAVLPGCLLLAAESMTAGAGCCTALQQPAEHRMCSVGSAAERLPDRTLRSPECGATSVRRMLLQQTAFSLFFYAVTCSCLRHFSSSQGLLDGSKFETSLSLLVCILGTNSATPIPRNRCSQQHGRKYGGIAELRRGASQR